MEQFVGELAGRCVTVSPHPLKKSLRAFPLAEQDPLQAVNGLAVKAAVVGPGLLFQGPVKRPWYIFQCDRSHNGTIMDSSVEIKRGNPLRAR